MFATWLFSLYPSGLLMWPVGGPLVTLVLTAVLLATVAGLIAMRERPEGDDRSMRAVDIHPNDRRLPSAA